MNAHFHPRRRQPVQLTRRLARRWSRILDGEHLWGSLDVGPHRQGFREYRLVVFPPGHTATERRMLRLWRAWPVWGAVLWLLLAVGLCGRPAPWADIAISTIVYLGLGLVTLAFAGQVRSRVRTLRVQVIDGHPDARSAAMYAELLTLVNILCDADAKRDRAEFSAVDHEAACWRVYDRLAPHHPRSVGKYSSI